MIKSLSFFLLLGLPAPALYGAADAAVCQELRIRSAEAFLEAIAYELKKTTETQPALARLQTGEAAAALAAKAGAGRELTQEKLFLEAEALIPLDGLEPAALEKARAAIAEARAYIAPPAAPACAPAPPPVPSMIPGDTFFYEDGTPETAGTDPGLIRWKDPAGYTASRIGPLSALLDRLGPEDQIWLANLPLSTLLPYLYDNSGITALSLPISGYAKKLWLLTGADGRRTLLLSDFQGRIYLRHFELLLKSYFSGKKGPAIKAAEAPSAYEHWYKALARLHGSAPEALEGLEGLIAGYGESFRTYWASSSAGSVADAENDWRLDIYRPAGAGKWGVITARSSFYGETLGENIRYLIERSTGIRTVVIAGSGGSLEPRPLYVVAYPSHVLTPGGREVPNALGSEADFRAHKSALSPLEETPAWLGRALQDGVSTVDVEMGPAAELLAGLGLRLGFAVLVTDFPIHRPAIEAALQNSSLARQDAGAKYRNIEAYVRGLEEWLRQGVPPGWQPLEKKLGRPLQEQSALNLAAEERRLAPLSGSEKKLLARLETFFRESPPAFSVRMSRARAARILEDQAFLSTELVSELKGGEVKPFTPDYEQDSYRAYRYIFGTLSYWDGPEKYGDTVLRLKDNAWRRRAWATRRSGMRALAITADKAGTTMEAAANDPALVKEAEETFASWVVTPAHLPRALALQVIGELREMPSGVFKEFMDSRQKRLPDLIVRHDVGWLEGKLWEAARVEDIELIKTTGTAPELAKKAAELGIKVLQLKPPQSAKKKAP